mmetsp:Transcript_1503/g.4063  ORF Transcript_1503/g.4063 Transcript_1503/m.4063 type:complete len:817 (+) Transcript_1503:1-2451(+)
MEVPMLDAQTWRQIAMHAVMVAEQLENMQSSGSHIDRRISECPGRAHGSHSPPQRSQLLSVSKTKRPSTRGKSKSTNQSSLTPSSSVCLTGNLSPAIDVLEDRVQRIRRQDREKKRRTRNASVSLVQQLEDALFKLGHGGKNRTLLETLAVACNAIKCFTSNVTLRRAMMSRRQSGLISLDASIPCVLEANEFILSRVANPPMCPSSAPLPSIFSSGDAEESAEIIRQLSTADDCPRRFILGFSFKAGRGSSEPDESFSAEFVRCFTPGDGRRPLFLVHVLPLRPVDDPSSSVVRAMRSLAGFRPHDKSVTLVPSGLAIAWKSPSNFRTKPRDRFHQGFSLSFRHVVRNCDLGNDFPPVAAPWAVEFLLRGLVEGDWRGLREWLLSPSTQLPGPRGVEQRAAALRAIDILSGSVPDGSELEGWEQRVLRAGTELEGRIQQRMLPGLRMEMRTEEGVIFAKILVRGLCLFEFRMEGSTMYPVLLLPAFAQNRTVEGNVPLEDMVFKHISKVSMLRVRDDGAVFGHRRPTDDLGFQLFGRGERIDKCVVLERDYMHTEDNTGLQDLLSSASARRGKGGPASGEVCCDRDSVGEAFRFSRFCMQGQMMFTTSRRWVRAGTASRQYPDAGGLDVRNALLEMYYTMRASQGLPVADGPLGRLPTNPTPSTMSTAKPGKHIPASRARATAAGSAVMASAVRDREQSASEARHQEPGQMPSRSILKDCVHHDSAEVPLAAGSAPTSLPPTGAASDARSSQWDGGLAAGSGTDDHGHRDANLASLLDDPVNNIFREAALGLPADETLDWLDPSPWNDFCSSTYI